MCGVGRHGLRRRHGHPPGRGPLPASPRRPATPPPSWTGWRSGCRPSGRDLRRRTAPRSPSSGPPSPSSGPRSRDVLAQVAPELAVANDGVPVHDLARRRRSPGIRARVCRISFSGELAFEINVVGVGRAARCGRRCTRPAPTFGITPYGTETMHVLRAEKGYPIIGQDTDGTVTPQDLGMGWVVSKKKPDFIGKRSYARADTGRARPQAPRRRCCPVDPAPALPEGTQLVGRQRAARRRRCRCSATSPPATAARRSAGPSRSP